jgi:hypothetical protein
MVVDSDGNTIKTYATDELNAFWDKKTEFLYRKLSITRNFGLAGTPTRSCKNGAGSG